MPIWEWEQLWHVCHKYLWSKKSYGWSFIPRSLSYYKVYHDRGATVSFTLTGTHHCRWPLVKGGLKIPCKVSVTVPGTCLNLLSLKRYKQLSEKLNIEAKKVTLLGSFLTPVQEPKRQNTKILYNLHKKSIVYWIPTWSYSIFPRFLFVRSTLYEKGFQNSWKKFSVFLFAIFKHRIFRGFYFAKVSKNREIAKNSLRQNVYV